LFIFFLTGCSSNINEIGEMQDREIKNIEQINLLDEQYFTLLQLVSGLQVSRQRIVTRIEENTSQGSEAEEKSQEEEKKETKENEANKVEMTEIEQRDILLNENTESDWNAARITCERIQDIVIDIQIAMKNSGIDEQTINQYRISIDELINYVVKADKENVMIQLLDLYNYSNMYNEKCYNNEKLYLAKKLDYSIVKSLIYLEIDDKEQFKNSINELAVNVDEINNKIDNENIQYIKERIINIVNTLKENTENEEKENIKLKLIILIEIIPIIDNSIEY